MAKKGTAQVSKMLRPETFAAQLFSLLRVHEYEYLRKIEAKSPRST